MSSKFPRAHRIRTRTDFQRVYQQGQLYQDGFFRIFYLRKDPTEPGRLGVSVGKSLGKATVRNRLKRLLRETFRRHPQLSAGLELIVQPQSAENTRERFLQALKALAGLATCGQSTHL